MKNKWLFFVEYMQVGSGMPVDMTVGCQSVTKAVKHGRNISRKKGYCGFWVSTKQAQAGASPVRLAYHPVWRGPDGKVSFGKPLTREELTRKP